MPESLWYRKYPLLFPAAIGLLWFIALIGWNKGPLLSLGSMYGIFTYIWLIFMVNVRKYTIHGWSGLLIGLALWLPLGVWKCFDWRVLCVLYLVKRISTNIYIYKFLMMYVHLYSNSFCILSISYIFIYVIWLDIAAFTVRQVLLFHEFVITKGFRDVRCISSPRLVCSKRWPLPTILAYDRRHGPISVPGAKKDPTKNIKKHRRKW